MIDVAALRATLAGRPARVFWAPGRVNLIGEHTDYSDGFALPMATHLGTAVAAAPSDDGRLRVTSRAFGETCEVDLGDLSPSRASHWIDYVIGIAIALRKRGVQIRGADLVLESELPIASGLSSSAALEVAVALALTSICGAEVDPLALALAGREAENEAVGVPSGIMDQYASVFGKGGHALLLDCRAIECVAIPLETKRVAIVVCDSRQERRLVASGYAKRREECRRALDLLRGTLPELRALRDVDMPTLAKLAHALPEPLFRRCRHVVSENARTLAAADALRRGDFADFGRLLFESHASLRDDFEVSTPELDALVAEATEIPGVLGARLTGAGFGGCTVNLVERQSLDAFMDRMRKPSSSRARGAREPILYITEPGVGAHEVAVG